VKRVMLVDRADQKQLLREHEVDIVVMDLKELHVVWE